VAHVPTRIDDRVDDSHVHAHTHIYTYQYTEYRNRQARDTLDELDNIAKRLHTGREEIQRLETETNLARRELEGTKKQTHDTICSNAVEVKNLAQSRERMSQLREEIGAMETLLLQTKERLVEEENKIRTTKSIASDQLRLLQGDVSKLHHDFKAKQRVIEELEKHRRFVEEESEIRRRDLDSQLLAKARELEEENRKWNLLRGEIRGGRLEIEQLTNKRREIEAELARISEVLTSEASRYDVEEVEAKRKLETLDRQINEAERRARAAKEKMGALEGEQVLLQHGVEELRRQQGDLERAADTRRRTTEDEISQAQQQAQIAVRAARQATAQIEQKRAELETVSSELRATERRYEEIKRAHRDQEASVETYKEEAKALQAELDRLRKDVMAVKREEADLRHQTSLMRATTDSDSRKAEEIRRRRAAIMEEETSLKESEGRLKASLQALRTSCDEAQLELDEARAASERERRVLADVRARRTLLETDMTRLEEEAKFSQERVTEEGKRRSDAEAALFRVREEIARTQKELVTLQRRIAEETSRELDLKRRGGEALAIQERIRVEAEGLSALVSDEKRRYELLKAEQFQLVNDLKKSKDELRQVQQDHMKHAVTLETIKSQIAHSESVRDGLGEELARLREVEKMEIKRTERLEGAYNEAEARLKELRTELSNTEDDLRRAKSIGSDEEKRISDQRRVLRSTMEELANVERAIVESNRQLHEARHHAMVEIGQLGQAKQSAQSSIFLLNEAQRRVEKRGGGGDDVEGDDSAVRMYDSSRDAYQVDKARRSLSPGSRYQPLGTPMPPSVSTTTTSSRGGSDGSSGSSGTILGVGSSSRANVMTGELGFGSLQSEVAKLKAQSQSVLMSTGEVARSGTGSPSDDQSGALSSSAIDEILSRIN
jgi:chromosome segregation ATPase